MFRGCRDHWWKISRDFRWRPIRYQRSRIRFQTKNGCVSSRPLPATAKPGKQAGLHWTLCLKYHRVGQIGYGFENASGRIMAAAATTMNHEHAVRQQPVLAQSQAQQPTTNESRGYSRSRVTREGQVQSHGKQRNRRWRTQGSSQPIVPQRRIGAATTPITAPSELGLPITADPANNRRPWRRQTPRTRKQPRKKARLTPYTASRAPVPA